MAGFLSSLSSHGLGLASVSSGWPAQTEPLAGTVRKQRQANPQSAPVRRSPRSTATIRFPNRLTRFERAGPPDLTTRFGPSSPRT